MNDEWIKIWGYYIILLSHKKIRCNIVIATTGKHLEGITLNKIKRKTNIMISLICGI